MTKVIKTVYFGLRGPQGSVSTKGKISAELMGKFTGLTPRLLGLISPIPPHIANNIKIIRTEAEVPEKILEAGLRELIADSSVEIARIGEGCNLLVPTPKTLGELIPLMEQCIAARGKIVSSPPPATIQLDDYFGLEIQAHVAVSSEVAGERGVNAALGVLKDKEDKTERLVIAFTLIRNMAVLPDLAAIAESNETGDIVFTESKSNQDYLVVCIPIPGVTIIDQKEERDIF